LGQRRTILQILDDNCSVVRATKRIGQEPKFSMADSPLHQSMSVFVDSLREAGDTKWTAVSAQHCSVRLEHFIPSIPVHNKNR